MIDFKQQRGGTIVGFIVGLIVGLVIAVVVAMVVTKTSIPFSSKQAKQGKISELTTSQTSDPNKPMYGTTPAAKVSTDGENGDKVDKATASKNETKPEDKASNKQSKADAAKDAAIKDKAAKDAALKDAAKKGAVDEKWSYYLQTNAYREATDAESERAMLALTGFEARISETSSQGKPLYRIRLGPFSNIDTMNRVRGKLTNSGINAAVVRAPK